MIPKKKKKLLVFVQQTCMCLSKGVFKMTKYLANYLRNEEVELVKNGEVIDEVTVVIKGEIDGNGIIDSDDAIYMLRNTLFPDTAPVVEEDDVDGNGIYDSDDAIYLLRYTLFPDMFPLK